MRRILGFAGQGSQYYHMARGLYETDPTFQKWFVQAEEILRDYWGFSLAEKLYDPSKTVRDPLEDPTLSHPALFVVQYATAMSVAENTQPDAVFGISLGELVSMAVAGVWTFETAFQFVLRQVDWLRTKCPPGRLIAVIAPAPEIEEALEQWKHLYVFALRSSVISTLSMEVAAVPLVEAALRARQISFERLPAPYPFHSPWIESIKNLFLSDLCARLCLPPKLCLLSCTRATSVEHCDATFAWDVVRKPILLDQAIFSLIRPDDQVIDCSPTATIRAWIRSVHGADSPQFLHSRQLFSPFQKKAMQNMERSVL